MFGDYDYGAYDPTGYCWRHNLVTRGHECEMCIAEARDEALDLDEQEWWENTTPPEDYLLGSY